MMTINNYKTNKTIIFNRKNFILHFFMEIKTKNLTMSKAKCGIQEM